MKSESKRLFISDLPEEISEEDLSQNFKQYGKVTSVEIKERKDISSKHQFSHFAFINVDIDDRTLQACFEQFSQKKWKGHYLSIQLAKESFLDRLKREREEANKTAPAVTATNNSSDVKIAEIKINGVTDKQKTTKFKFNEKPVSDSDSDSDSDADTKLPVKPLLEVQDKLIASSSSSPIKIPDSIQEDDLANVYTDIIVKDNKNRVHNNKIESVGNEPITKVELRKQKSLDPKRTEANQKRMNSMFEMKKGYQLQKSAIKAALSKIDVQNKNKITFNDNGTANVEHKKKTPANKDPGKKQLFDDDGNDENADDYNFKVKKQFEGKKGQQLLELQSKFKNDSRFKMDERFIEDGGDDADNNGVIEEFQEQEKDQQLEILGQVLGKKITSMADSVRKSKAMLRFDPDHPEHSKYEMKEEPKSLDKKKRKRKDSAGNEDAQEQLPEVSKETFYQIKDTLSNALQEKESFSLLSTFGRKHDAEVNDEIITDETEASKTPKNQLEVQNPFKYDSSDDEGGAADEEKETAVTETTTKQTINLGPTKLWTEPFFFKKDDYRLQEGLDFIKRLAGEEGAEFSTVRRNLKEIVRAKVRHNQRKNRPFKKKLGGSSKKKMMRVKKALKR